ncbi:hypothetical protein C8R42DRAFT_308398 [Lentinula raphanica]|nr:hypothetical protein C8R42DRAFT_308398 [Lentinula raphanica]
MQHEDETESKGSAGTEMEDIREGEAEGVKKKMEFPTTREAFFMREHNELLYEKALHEWGSQPNDAEKAFEVVFTYAKLEESGGVTNGSTQPPAFPLEVFDQLLDVSPILVSTLPRSIVASAIGWNGRLLKHLAYARKDPIVIFNEANGMAPQRYVVYYGGGQFYSARTIDDAVWIVYEHWAADPPIEACDRVREGPKYGVQIIRKNIEKAYADGRDHKEGIDKAWAWLGDVWE